MSYRIDRVTAPPAITTYAGPRSVSDKRRLQALFRYIRTIWGRTDLLTTISNRIREEA